MRLDWLGGSNDDPLLSTSVVRACMPSLHWHVHRRVEVADDARRNDRWTAFAEGSACLRRARSQAKLCKLVKRGLVRVDPHALFSAACFAVLGDETESLQHVVGFVEVD